MLSVGTAQDFKMDSKDFAGFNKNSMRFLRKEFLRATWNMKNLYLFLIVFSFGFFCGLENAYADSVVMANGRILSGTAIQTNADEVLILTLNAAFNFSQSSIKEIRKDTESDTAVSARKLAAFYQAVLLLSKEPWATNLTPIPATVIDTGIFKNVPYTSLRCGQDYEVNIYGDLENPAGIEIGVYHTLLESRSTKENCRDFMAKALNYSADKEFLLGLNLNKDLKTCKDLTFEITPPTDADSYHGWWVSVYSQKLLNEARASDEEMKSISQTKVEVGNNARKDVDFASWSTRDLTQARPSAPVTISFMNTSGDLIANAEVVRVVENINLIWRSGKDRMGMIKLADLPRDLQDRFGYDEAKSKAADEYAKANRERRWQETQPVAQPQNVSSDFGAYSFLDSNYSSSGYSGGGRVYVRGYTKNNGTYVNSYTRSSPHRR